jgi:hypothetical protein
MPMTRDEHLAWSKARALKYLEPGPFFNPIEAITSMCSDLTKHDELKNHIGINLAMGLLMIGDLHTEREARRFIEGFN